MRDVQLASMSFLPEWQVEPDPVLLPNEKAKRTYDDDALRNLRRMGKKSAVDFLNAAIERRIRTGAISESEANEWRKKLLPLAQAEGIHQDTSDSKSVSTNR